MRLIVVGLIGTLLVSMTFVTGKTIGTCYWRGDSVKYYEDEILLGLENTATQKDIQSILNYFGSTITYDFGRSRFARITIDTQVDYLRCNRLIKRK